MKMVTDRQRPERRLVGVGIHACSGERWGWGYVVGASGTREAGETLSAGNKQDANLR